jgi:hypothetical protein
MTEPTKLEIAQWVYKAMKKPPFMLAEGEHPLSDFGGSYEDDSSEQEHPLSGY